jgi:hypothetical protein
MSIEKRLMQSIDKIGANFITIDGKSYQGGLYPGGLNIPTPEHEKALINTTKKIQPINGSIIFIGLGASNTAIEMASFIELATSTGGMNDDVDLVNGCKGGIALNKINDARDRYLGTYVNNMLFQAGLDHNDPQVAWLKTDDLVTDLSKVTFQEYIDIAVNQYIEAVQNIYKHLPNLKILYLTSRHTTKYVENPKLAKHKEPRAFYSQFVIKKLIELQISGDSRLDYLGDDAKAPLLTWGPLFYSEGSIPNTYGHNWESTDVKDSDHLHPNFKGASKTANYLYDFFMNNVHSSNWFSQQ